MPLGKWGQEGEESWEDSCRGHPSLRQPGLAQGLWKHLWCLSLPPEPSASTMDRAVFAEG